MLSGMQLEKEFNESQSQPRPAKSNYHSDTEVEWEDGNNSEGMAPGDLMVVPPSIDCLTLAYREL